MRLYRFLASTRCRAFLLAGLFLSAAAWTTAAWAQAAGAEGAAPATQEKWTVITVVFGQIADPIFWLIVVLSIVALTLIIMGFIKNNASNYMPVDSVDQMRELIQQKKFKELIEFTQNDPSFVALALHPALKRAPSFSSMKEAMETALGEQTAERFRSIEYLNIIGNLGPLLGLTGTVLGMIVAFLDMHNAPGGTATPAQLSGGISKALAHTFLGLMLAVPCLACFGILRTIVDRLTVRGALIAEELLLMVKPQETKPAAPAGRPGGPAVPPPPGMRRPPAIPAPAPAPMG